MKGWNAQVVPHETKGRMPRLMRISIPKTIDALQRKQNEAKEKLRELKTAGDSAII